MPTWLIILLSSVVITILIIMFDKTDMPPANNESISKLHIRIIKIFSIVAIVNFIVINYFILGDEGASSTPKFDIRQGNPPF